MVLSRRNHNTNCLEVDEYEFERVQNFKYPGEETNENANHE